MKTILLVDDDVYLCRSIESLLKGNNFDVFVSHESDSAEKVIQAREINLILLDLLLPGAKNGLELCKKIRETSSVPIIMLTGVEEDIDRIISLEVGADYYLTKPFNSRVLIAYIHAILRRSISALNVVDSFEFDILEFSGWKLNVTNRLLLSPDNKIVKTTSAEFVLLYIFLTHSQRVLSRDQLMELTNSNSNSFDRSIDILISRLRKKIEKNNFGAKIFVTIRNGGYLLSCKVKNSKISSEVWDKTLFLKN